MSVLIWLAVAWSASSAVIILAFWGARHSRRIAIFLFGRPVSTNVHRLEPRADRDRSSPDRLAA